MPGFELDNFIFKVARKQLKKGARLGRGKNNPGSAPLLLAVAHRPE